MQNAPQKKRWLFQILCLSLGLNILFLALFFYFIVCTSTVSFTFYPDTIKEEHPSLFCVEVFKRLGHRSFEELCGDMKDARLVKDGYCVRDLAVAALVTFHHLDLERALGKRTERQWMYGGKRLRLFPGLKEGDFQQLEAFIRREKYPWTAEGVFKQLKAGNAEEELTAYFCHTPPFVQMEILFARAGVPIQRGHVLKMVLEGEWEQLEEYYLKQRAQCSYGGERRRQVLLEYIRKGSREAAGLLLKTDFSEAVQYLGDADVAKILELIDQESEEGRKYMEVVRVAPRGDEVAARFYNRPAEGNLRPVFRDEPPAALPSSVHVIQPGESLWTIARKYKVPMERLMEANNLRSTTIREGKMLKIPS